MKNLFKMSIFMIVLLFILSCSNDDPIAQPPTPNPNITYSATLNGASEVPSNTSTATGNATLTFNNTTKIFTITVNYTGLTVTNAHIHKGAVGVSGPPAFGFSSFTSPIAFTSPALDAAQEADLKANLYYVNLHSAAYPGGEIRGQLIKLTYDGEGGGY